MSDPSSNAGSAQYAVNFKMAEKVDAETASLNWDMMSKARSIHSFYEKTWENTDDPTLDWIHVLQDLAAYAAVDHGRQGGNREFSTQVSKLEKSYQDGSSAKKTARKGAALQRQMEVLLLASGFLHNKNRGETVGEKTVDQSSLDEEDRTDPISEGTIKAESRL